MAKRRTVVDDLRDLRQALGSLPPDDARSLLRGLAPLDDKMQLRMSSDEKRAWTFTTPGGRTFTVGKVEHHERYKGDPLWSDSYPILDKDNQPAGTLFCNENYGRTTDGKPRWQASTRQLYWCKAADAPTGIGFDVAAFDTTDECLAAWARSADQILDWNEGKLVQTPWSGGVRRRAKP